MKETTENQSLNGLNEADALKKVWVKPEIQLIMVNFDGGTAIDALDGESSTAG